MPPGTPPPERLGQALAELVIALVVLISLIIGVTTLTRLSLTQIRLRQDIRLEAGTEALTRATHGWVDPIPLPESRSAPEHRINAFTRLETFSPALTSRLPASSYTLAARDLPEQELGLRTVTETRRIPLDDAFARLFYPKGSLTLRETLTFPATSGLWTDTPREK